MSELDARQTFGRLCQQVCASQGWRLLPTGVEVRWGDGRHQLVRLELFDHDGQTVVRLLTSIGPVGDLERSRLLQALRANGELAHGALAVRDEELVMTDTLLVAEADAREMEAAVAFLARTADDYERVLFDTDDH